MMMKKNANMSIPPQFSNPCDPRALDDTCDVITEVLDRRYCKDVIPPITVGTFNSSRKASRQDRAAILKAKVWDQGQEILIRFLDGTSEQQDWVRHVVVETYVPLVNLRLTFVPSTYTSKTDVRISFDPDNGSWSYLGKEALLIPENEPTMNFAWLDLPPLTGGVVMHEFGHCIGPFIHEHQNPTGKPIQWNVPVVLSSLCGTPNNWSRRTICENIFDKFKKEQIRGSAYDPLSIMQYPYPMAWTLHGVGVQTPQALSDQDRYWLKEQYPTTTPAPMSATTTRSSRTFNHFGWLIFSVFVLLVSVLVLATRINFKIRWLQNSVR